MKEVTLTFRDNNSIAEFILTNKVGKVVVNSALHTISGPLPDDLVVLALTRYGAELSQLAPYRFD